MNEALPARDRLFTTSFYSVENYLVHEDVFVDLCRDFIQCRGLACDHEQAGKHFSHALSAFYDLILPIMAWIIAVRRSGQAPNLRNIKLQVLFKFDSDLRIQRIVRRDRIARLCTITGIAPTPGIAREIRKALIELRSYDPKCVVRGHFESWFFVAYMKALLERLRTEAQRQGGTAMMIPTVEHNILCRSLCPESRCLPNSKYFWPRPFSSPTRTLLWSLRR